LYLIDTNIFLEAMLNRKYKGECQALLRMIDDGDTKAFVTTYSIHSIETILDKIGNLEALRIFLKSIGKMKGLNVYNTDLKDEIAIIDEMELGLDFDDALQSYVAKKLNLKIVSFDRHFDGVEGMTRLRPKDVLLGRK
jgi:predicted nucleic acid-binding protein